MVKIIGQDDEAGTVEFFLKGCYFFPDVVEIIFYHIWQPGK